jgi:hypothetical protein
MPPTALRVANSEHLSRLSEIQGVAKDLPTKFIVCRDLNHNWAPHDLKFYTDGSRDRIVRCRSCSTKRIMVISSRGMMVSSHYEYPEGYLIQGLGLLAGEERGLIRLESMDREWEQRKKKAAERGQVVEVLTRDEEPKSTKKAPAKKATTPTKKVAAKKVATKTVATKSVAKKATKKGAPSGT